MLVLVYGEDRNDAEAVVYILRSFLPEKYRVSYMPRPTIFAAAGTEKFKRLKNADKVAASAKLAAKRTKVALVVIHRDADAVEPAHVPLAEQIEAEFGTRIPFSVIAAVPAWELEAWLLLYPELVGSHRACWRTPRLGNSHRGSIANAKERLRRETRGSGQACPAYTESDAPGIARRIWESGEPLSDKFGMSASLERFVSKTREELKID